MLTTDDMDVEVVNCLTAMHAFVDDGSIARVGHALFSCNLCAHDHEVSKECRVSVFSLADSSETVTVLGDDEEVLGGDRCDIVEGQALVVFIDDVSGDFLPDNFVEDGDFFWRSRLCQLLFTVCSFYHF